LTTGGRAADEGRAPEARSGQGFTARGGWHLVAFLAAMVLILGMSIDWYSTDRGEELRRIEDVNRDSPRPNSQDAEDAAQGAENQEKNAWQADAFIDRLILIALLVAFVGAVVAAFMRSAGRRLEPPLHPSAIATVAGVAGTLLVLYRMIQPPGLNEAAVVKAGAPIGLAAVGILTVASRLAVLTEREEATGAVPDAGPATAPEPEPAERTRGRLGRMIERRGRGRPREEPPPPVEPALAPVETDAAAGEPGPDEF
jgi:hypothetical protein